VSNEFRELSGLRVNVDKVVLMPHLDAPQDRPYPYVYFLTIINDSHESVIIESRKWILRDLDGDVLVVEGHGVVGENPHLKPGESFSYHSYHVIKTDTEARGSLFGRTESSQKLRVSIPPFKMIIAPELS
jgi:ApaG protein